MLSKWLNFICPILLLPDALFPLCGRRIRPIAAGYLAGMGTWPATCITLACASASAASPLAATSTVISSTTVTATSALSHHNLRRRGIPA